MTQLIIPPAVSTILPSQYTIATLPDPTQFIRKYAWTTDLFGGPGDYCISDGVTWKPVRPFKVTTTANAATSMTFSALGSAPTQILQGTLGGNVNHTFSMTGAYPGAKIRFLNQMTLGLFSINLIGAVTTVLGLNKWSDMECNGTAWVQTASGGLL